MSIKRVNIITVSPDSQAPFPTAIDAANIVYDINENALYAALGGRSQLEPIVSSNTVVKRSSSIPTGSTDTVGENNSATWDNNIFYWKTNNIWYKLSGVTFNSIASLTTKDIVDNFNLTAESGGNITDNGGLVITEKGVVWGTNPNPTLSDNSTTDGSGSTSYDSTLVDLEAFVVTYVRAYATNSSGTAYGNQLFFEPNICLAKGTKVLLSNNVYKNIEDITYEDLIKTWNFDEGHFDEALPLWIKKAEKSNKYNSLTFSDGSVLNTISQHRIFNLEKGMFTYPMTDDTPIGTTTFNSSGEKIKLINKEVIFEEIEYYNVITTNHINLFANDILTSCRYNNIYPIIDMKFVKEPIEKRNREEFKSIDDKYYHGLRLSEQNFPLKDIENYIKRLERKKASL